MTLRAYLFCMSIATLLCWLAWILVVNGVDPYQTGLVGFLLFYVSLFLAGVGTFSVIGFVVRRRIVKNDDVVFRHVTHTFRQGITVSLLLIGALLLLQAHLLTWWTALLLMLLFLVVEGVLLTHEQHIY